METQNINENRLVNIPKYKDVLNFSSLSSGDFTEEDYNKYCESLSNRALVIREQIDFLKTRVSNIDHNFTSGSSNLEMSLTQIKSLLTKTESEFAEMYHQEDLFPSDQDTFLVETNLDKLSDRVRELKTMVVALYSMGTYQATSYMQSGQGVISAGQVAEPETLALYARSDLSPVESEKHFGTLISAPDGFEKETLLFNSGMGALSTTMMSITSRNIDGRKIMFPRSAYFESSNLYEEKSSEIPSGISNFYSDQTDLMSAVKSEADLYTVFVEPVSNTVEMKEVNFSELINSFPKNKKRKYIVIDYALCGTEIDLRSLGQIDDDTVVFMVTSMQKMYQEGDDIAQSGLVNIIAKNPVIVEEETVRLKRLRSITGNNISSNSLLLLQKISPDTIKLHTKTIQKNVFLLSQKINPLEVCKVYKAGEKDDRSNSVLFFLKFDKPESGEFFCQRCIERARERKINISLGASFGFRDSRFFMYPDDTSIVRVAPGIESRREITVLAEIINESLKDVEVSQNVY